MRSFSLVAAAALLAVIFTGLRAAEPLPVSELQERAAIENLVVRYTIALDTLDADMYESVFAPDAEFTFAGNTFKGREQIRAIVARLQEQRVGQPADAPRMYHALSNTYIELTSPTEARHRSYWQTITGPASGPFNVGAMGVYEDVLVKRDGEWLIRNRKIVQ